MKIFKTILKLIGFSILFVILLIGTAIEFIYYENIKRKEENVGED